MARSSLISLRLFPTGPGAEERISSIFGRLGSHRPLSAGERDWQVLYRASDISEAMAMCAADLDLLDPAWEEILDFEAIPSFPRLGRRADRPTS